MNAELLCQLAKLGTNGLIAVRVTITLWRPDKEISSDKTLKRRIARGLELVESALTGWREISGANLFQDTLSNLEDYRMLREAVGAADRKTLGRVLRTQKGRLEKVLAFAETSKPLSGKARRGLADFFGRIGEYTLERHEQLTRSP